MLRLDEVQPSPRPRCRRIEEATQRSRHAGLLLDVPKPTCAYHHDKPCCFKETGLMSLGGWCAHVDFDEAKVKIYPGAGSWRGRHRRTRWNE